MNEITKLNDCLYAIATPFPYSLGSYVRSYLIKGNAGLALIDAGTILTHHQVINLLKQLGEKRTRLKVIALTHAHGDHVGAVNRLKQATGCLVAVHRGGAELLGNIELMFQDFMGSFQKEFPITRSTRSGWFSIANASSNPDIQFEGDAFRLDLGGIVLEAKPSPGHSSDSVCWYEPQKQWLFTGDAICGLGPFSETPCYRDVGIYRTTLEKISQLPINKLYSAHFPEMEQQSAEDFFEQSVRVVDRIDTIVREQLQLGAERITFKDLAQTVAQAIDKQFLVNTLFTTRAHLLDLEKQGYTVSNILETEV